MVFTVEQEKQRFFVAKNKITENRHTEEKNKQITQMNGGMDKEQCPDRQHTHKKGTICQNHWIKNEEKKTTECFIH